MLAALRSTVSGFLAKALMMLLVISFAIWGIGDILRTTGTSYVASIGGERISMVEFQRELARLKRAMEASNLPKVDDRALAGQLMRQILIERLTNLRMHDLGLSVGDTLLASKLRTAPIFQNPDGTFNSNAFRAMLHQRGMSEEGFLAQMKNDMKSRALLDSIDTSDIALPDALLAMQALAAGETRDAVVVTLPIAAANPKAPSEKELKDYYDQQKEVLYIEPEKRTLEYATFGASDITALVDKRITDTVVKDKYESEKTRFAKPEERHVLQLLASDSKDAATAKAAIKPGAGLGDLHKAVAGAKQTDLGTVARDKLPAAAGDAVFAAKSGEVVGPVDTDFGQAFYQVTAIQPASTADFEKVKPIILAELRDEARDKTMQDVSNQLEDTLAAGKSMHDALAAAGISSTAHELKSVTPDTARESKDPLTAAVAAQGFSLNEGETSNLNVARSGAYFVVHVKAVTPATPKPFEAVRADVDKRLRTQAAADETSERAGTLIADLHKNKDWQAVLNAQHASGRTVGNIARSGNTAGLPGPLAQAVFEHAPGGAAGPFTLPTGDVMLAIVTGVHHNPAAKLTDAKRKELAGAFKEEVMQQYFESLSKRYPVDVNQKVLAEAVRGNADE